jgi:hypothetical protein
METNKKEYVAPEIKEFKMDTTVILAGSETTFADWEEDETI